MSTPPRSNSNTRTGFASIMATGRSVRSFDRWRALSWIAGPASMRDINDEDSLMGKRLSRITTRTGDDGTTGLGDGSRTGKDDPRIAAMGDVDELNAALGLLLVEHLPEAMAAMLVEIQHDLFELGGELCIPGYENLAAARIEWLDAMIAESNAGLPHLEEFVLPGGCRAAALAHQARTI